MSRILSIYLFLSLFFSTILLQAQIKSIGVPFITNYSPKTYQAASENWDVAQDSSGAMFFGNHFGLLQFDGTRWKIVTQPDNKSMVRSLAIGKDKIYIGAQGDFGYATVQANGQYVYHSLVRLLPDKYQNFGDVWYTKIRGDKVIFFSRKEIIIYQTNRIRVIKYEEEFEDSFDVEGQLYFISIQKGLLRLQGDRLVKVIGGEKILGMRVRMIFKKEKSLMILTQTNGFFMLSQQKLIPWRTDADNLLMEGQVSSAIILSQGYYGIGTRQNGLIIIDKAGHLVQHINKETGLQNDYITKLKTDRNGNLWVALKDGIDFVEIASPFSKISDNRYSDPKIYASVLHQNKLYIGTDNGLYWLDWEAYKYRKSGNISFQRVAGINENVWSLGVFDGILLAFEASGTFEINGSKANLLSPLSSTWQNGAWQGNIMPTNPDILIVGGYTGLYSYKKQNNHWVFQAKVKGFNETCRVLSFDKLGNIWMAHGYKGIYKIKLNQTFDAVEKIRFYDHRDGFPSNLFLNTFKVKEQILFGSRKGVYKYDIAIDKMKPDELFEKYLGLEKHVRLLKPDSKNNIWYVAGDNTGVIHLYKDGSFHSEELPFRRLQNVYIPGFENIQTDDEGDVLIGTQNGLIHYSSNTNKNYQAKFEAVISDVKCIVPRDSILFSNVTSSTNELFNDTNHHTILPYKNNAIRFSFSSFWYENPEITQYQYWLEGFENDWSSWNKLTEKEYTNLPEGKYIFHVKAKNLYDVVGKEATFNVEILPPIYRSYWAYGLYIILFTLLIYGIVRYQQHLASLERSSLLAHQAKELLIKQAELEKQKMVAEKDRTDIVNVNLETTIKLKNSKVATNTVNLIHLNEILLSIREYIVQIQNSKDPKIHQSIVSKIDKIIEQEIQGDKHWGEFEEIFNQLHNNFIQRLKIHYPELTPRDIRLCAYLRMNLNTKEIAPLLGISVRGVEDTRYRIRKKVHLSPEDNLAEFILSF